MWSLSLLMSECMFATWAWSGSREQFLHCRLKKISPQQVVGIGRLQVISTTRPWWVCLWRLWPVLFVTVRAGTAYRKIWRLVNNFFCSHNKVHCSEIPNVLSNLLYHYFFHWIMAHFNFLISQNAKWGHAGFYIDCHRMTSLLTCAWLISTVPENILLQKSTAYDNESDSIASWLSAHVYYTSAHCNPPTS